MTFKPNPQEKISIQSEQQQETPKQETPKQETLKQKTVKKNQMKINKLLDTYDKKNNTFHVDKIKLKNSMNYKLSYKIIQFYNTYKKNISFNVDSYFITLINNYNKNHMLLIFLTIDLHYNQIIDIAKKIAELRLQNYILLNNQQSIKDIKSQIETLQRINLETKQKYLTHNSIDKSYITQITQINEAKKKECYICYEPSLLYKFYECSHYICNTCYNNIENKRCSLCKSNYIEHQHRGLPHNHNVKYNCKL